MRMYVFGVMEYLPANQIPHLLPTMHGLFMEMD
ncbi:hypothetical protein Golob_012909 [Gossypium lobatum]|uniref:Uncharacterized protein n=1 Tax=Gossypium lobatum TaxID=34289 RepID=A0A7J8LMY6_9ROSI|nr:hypothetical protein [Gossypium lobatum]